MVTRVSVISKNSRGGPFWGAIEQDEYTLLHLFSVQLLVFASWSIQETTRLADNMQVIYCTRKFCKKIVFLRTQVKHVMVNLPMNAKHVVADMFTDACVNSKPMWRPLVIHTVRLSATCHI